MNNRLYSKDKDNFGFDESCKRYINISFNNNPPHKKDQLSQQTYPSSQNYKHVFLSSQNNSSSQPYKEILSKEESEV
jgi:hypothetical protein